VVTAGDDTPAVDSRQEQEFRDETSRDSTPRLAAVRAEDRPPPEETADSGPGQPATQDQWQGSGEVEPASARPSEPAVPQDGKYTVGPNDNLWTISEKVYGNGRYFKAIYEHNRARLPHADRLTVGTVIEV